jgi:hypothetical protein
VRVLLDESVPRRLGFDLSPHFVRSVQTMGWAGLKNGALLAKARDEFDVLVTADRNLRYQQNPEQLSIALIVMRGSDNTYQTLKLLTPALLQELATIGKGQIVEIGDAAP